MAKLTKFEKEVMSAEHKYFDKIKTDLYGYKIMLKSSGVKKFTERNNPCCHLSELSVSDYVMVKYRIPKGSDIYVSETSFNGWKKCRSSEVEIVEIRELIEYEYDKIHVGKQYNGYAYSTWVVMAAYNTNKNIMSECSAPAAYGRCKKGQKFLMKNFFHLTPDEIDKKLSEESPWWYREKYNTYNLGARMIGCKRRATCNRGFHFFMEEVEALNYFLHTMLLRIV